MALVVIPGLQIRPGCRDAVLAAAADDARRSAATEPGRRQVDVARPEGREDSEGFYGVRDSRSAFGAHRETPRFAERRRP